MSNLSSAPPTDRYRPTYRADELRLIAQQAQRGESLCFVGIAGAGKSNLVNSVRDEARMATYLGTAASQVHFAVVDANTWQKTPLSLWTLMATSLEALTSQWPAPAMCATSPPGHRVTASRAICGVTIAILSGSPVMSRPGHWIRASASRQG